tara:strand:+ start:151833 stop:152078 length:246 start_codon:yes stop_codon:yes gene_type:complete
MGALAATEITTKHHNTTEDVIPTGMIPATMTITPANLIAMEIISTINQGTTISTRQDTGMVVIVVIVAIVAIAIKRNTPVL